MISLGVSGLAVAITGAGRTMGVLRQGNAPGHRFADFHIAGGSHSFLPHIRQFAAAVIGFVGSLFNWLGGSSHRRGSDSGLFRQISFFLSQRFGHGAATALRQGSTHAAPVGELAEIGNFGRSGFAAGGRGFGSGTDAESQQLWRINLLCYE